MTVRGRDGDLGMVAEVVADASADIFRGITVSLGLFSHNVFVPGDRVTAVDESVVTVDLDEAEAKLLTPGG